MTEAALSSAYQRDHVGDFHEEVIVGELVLEAVADESREPLVSQSALSADLHRPSDSELTLVECKQELDVTAIGQLLTYARLFDYDRRLGRRYFYEHDDPDRLDGLPRAHFASDAESDMIRPPLTGLDLRIATGALPAQSRSALLRACVYHGITVEYYEYDQWSSLTEPLTTDRTVAPGIESILDERRTLAETLSGRARAEIQSSREAAVLERMEVDDNDADVFKEVRLTGNWGDDQSGIRADAIVLPQSEGPLRAVELKDGSKDSDGARTYYKGVGQSLSAAALCELEFGIETRPVLAFDSLPFIGALSEAPVSADIPWEAMWPTIRFGG